MGTSKKITYLQLAKKISNGLNHGLSVTLLKNDAQEYYLMQTHQHNFPSSNNDEVIFKISGDIPVKEISKDIEVQISQELLAEIPADIDFV